MPFSLFVKDDICSCCSFKKSYERESLHHSLQKERWEQFAPSLVTKWVVIHTLKKWIALLFFSYQKTSKSHIKNKEWIPNPENLACILKGMGQTEGIQIWRLRSIPFSGNRPFLEISWQFFKWKILLVLFRANKWL